MSEDRVAQVRAKLAEVKALCVGVQRMSEVWSMTPAQATYFAAASPNVLLRLVTEAEGVLDRHPEERPNQCGEDVHNDDDRAVDWPCPEVEAVLRAWAP